MEYRSKLEHKARHLWLYVHDRSAENSGFVEYPVDRQAYAMSMHPVVRHILYLTCSCLCVCVCELQHVSRTL